MFQRYTVNNQHRNNNNKAKSQWCITTNYELDIFTHGLINGWLSNDKTILWSVHRSGNDTIIGMESQENKNKGSKCSDLYIAKFTCDHNEEWHGYPISGYQNDSRNIPKQISDDWLRRKLISKRIFNRFQQGKI